MRNKAAEQKQIRRKGQLALIIMSESLEEDGRPPCTYPFLRGLVLAGNLLPEKRVTEWYS